MSRGCSTSSPRSSRRRLERESGHGASGTRMRPRCGPRPDCRRPATHRSDEKPPYAARCAARLAMVLLMTVKPQILALGGGFAALESAFLLRMRLHDAVDIRLVSTSDQLTFRPNSIYVPFGADPASLLVDLRKPLHRRHASAAIPADVVSRRAISGWFTAAWPVFIFVAPFLGVLVYLIAHSTDMAERRGVSRRRPRPPSTRTRRRSQRRPVPRRTRRPRGCSTAVPARKPSSSRPRRRRSPSVP